MPLDLSLKHNRDLLAERIKADIDIYAQNAYDDGFRAHLGASIIGRKCMREVWYSWRWMKKIVFEGRMMRLFNRGHREEPRFIEFYTGIEAKIWDTDDKGDQFRCTGVEGHFGGSLDGVIQLPERYDVAETMLGEFKTHNDKSFKKLVKKGVRAAKPEHFVQMSAYGRAYGFKYAIYNAVNKNDDELHVSVEVLDWGLAEEVYRKADFIIHSQVPPQKIALNPADFNCKMCDYRDICHYGEKPAVNCRSCAYAVPGVNKEWHCTHFNVLLSPELIKTGCTTWKPLA